MALTSDTWFYELNREGRFHQKNLNSGRVEIDANHTDDDLGR